MNMGPDNHHLSLVPDLPLRGEPEPSLAEVRRRHPDFDIIRVFGGYEAVPRGTPVIRAVWLSSLDEKLTVAEEQS
jgi:hypothetical protein